MSSRRSIWRHDMAQSLNVSFSREMADHSRGLRKWELTILREQCKEKDLEEFYMAYMRRLHKSQLYSFMTMLIFCTGIHSALLLATLDPEERDYVYEDVSVYLGGTILTIIILSLNLKQTSPKVYPLVANMCAFVATILLMLMDTSVTILHMYRRSVTLPVYINFIIFSIYCFLPITSHIFAIILGFLVSAVYVVFLRIQVYVWINQGSPSFRNPTKAASFYVGMICMNLFGIFMRLAREAVTRMTFLDKRQCIEEDILFHAAKDQEKNLLLSMIPKQIAKQMEDDVKLRIELMKNPHLSTSLDKIRKLFIEPHDDVTILYADIVNYTKLTTTLDVKSLVETLHELYVRFDDGAQELDVLRIQFLGDCYYCVANVSIPNEEHAKSCVKLGLRMIKDIREVGNSRNRGIDMRIGVHSGSVLSGVIGASKWQFDIYSKDVEIANRLESTGIPGRVHISKETLDRLDNRFQYEPGTKVALDDALLRKHQITTFLIVTPNEIENNLITRRSVFVRAEFSEENVKEVDSFERMRTMIHNGMSQESNRFPIIGFVQQYKRLVFGSHVRERGSESAKQHFYENISWLFMWYKNWRWEFSYMQQSDILHKYSVLVSYIVFCGTVILLYFNMKQANIFWELSAIGNFLFLLILAMLWYRKVWSFFFATMFIPKPRKKVSLFLFKLSDKAQKNFKFRTLVYVTIILLQIALICVELLDCSQFQVINDIMETHAYGADINEICFTPWAITHAMDLTIGIIFLFTHISYVLKWIIALVVLIFHIIVVFVVYDFMFEYSTSSNPYFLPQYVHFMELCRVAWIFHIMNREIEFISRMDFNWKHELRKKKDNAKFTNETISILIGNILPAHIVNIYMKDHLASELCYEEYQNVAVMFATIRNYDTEQVGMRVLNEIICDFDEVLSTYQGFNKIEKIKVANWTYMAACGLSSTNSIIKRNRSNLENKESDFKLAASASEISGNSELQAPVALREVGLSNDVVFVMMRFALDLMKKMRQFNEENIQSDDKRTQGALRIGIANGPVMAGVVGLYKPFYDIWGNAVNLASRMDSTGLENCIQVPEETANILMSYDVQCTFRGMTFAKGLDYIPTYFVEIDDDFQFVQQRTDEAVT
ncbi:adenylate cyclase type 2 isoform X1 [Ceratitis capitata]|nr:adenylate cyclase type 2 isoform X1 [Ceratitis capitata]